MGRNTLKLSFKGFEEYAAKIEDAGGSLKEVFTDALSQAGETIGEDTMDAISTGNLPAGGKYSDGQTADSVIQNPPVEWNGTVGSIGVGFDYGKPGAGGFLITGTPKMKPDAPLNKMYKGSRYMKGIQDDMKEVFDDALSRLMGGG